MDFIIMCLQFMKTGLFAVGGGLATIPFLYEMAAAYGWFTSKDILTFIAVAESTPGPVGVNMATYAGFTGYGWYGGILTTLCLVFPSVVVVMIIAKMLDQFKSNRFVHGGFRLLRPASTALIAAAGFNVIIMVFFGVEKITFDMFSNLGEVFTHFDWIACLLFAALFVAMKYIKIHPLFYILVSAGLGILFQL